MGPNEGAIASAANPNFAPNPGVAPQSSPDSFTPPIPGAMGTPVETSNQNSNLLPGSANTVPNASILPGAGIPGMAPEAQATIGTPAYISQTPAYTEAPLSSPVPTENSANAYVSAPPPMETSNAASGQPGTFAAMDSNVPKQPDLRDLPSSAPLGGPQQFPPNPAEAPQNPIAGPDVAPQPAPPSAESTPNLDAIVENWKSLSLTEMSNKFDEFIKRARAEGKDPDIIEGVARAYSAALLEKTGFSLEKNPV